MRKLPLFALRALCCGLLLAVLFSVFVPAAAEEVDVLAGSRPLLVNKENPVDADFVPAGLVLLTEVLDTSLVRVQDKNIRAVRTAAEALEVMLEAAKADGVRNWQISTAYRSIKDQEALLERRIKRYQKEHSGWSRSRAKSAALRSVAEPGCSEHHLGLAFDINVPNTSAFKGTRQCKWLHAHCWEYGFVVRYQEDKTAITGFTAEEWHIRYVGTEHSIPMRDGNLCLEEYLAGLPDDPAVFLVVEDTDFPDL